MKNNRGGILLEFTMAFSLLFLFTTGFALTHTIWNKRFENILLERNGEINSIRAQKTQFFSLSKFFRTHGERIPSNK